MYLLGGDRGAGAAVTETERITQIKEIKKREIMKDLEFILFVLNVRNNNNIFIKCLIQLNKIFYECFNVFFCKVN